jgi:hypothetical protein
MENGPSFSDDDLVGAGVLEKPSEATGSTGLSFSDKDLQRVGAFSDEEVQRVTGAKPKTSAFGTFAREAVEAAPTLPAIIAGAEAGGAALAPAAPFTFGLAPIAGAIAGGALFGLGARYLENKALEATGVREGEGFFSAKQKEAGLAEHPEAGFAGEMLGTAGLGFKAGLGTTPLVQRVLGGGLMGTLELGTEALQGEDINLGHVGEAAATGALFASPRKWTAPFQQMGQKLGGKMAGSFSRAAPDTVGAADFTIDPAGNARPEGNDQPAGTPDRPNAGDSRSTFNTDSAKDIIATARGTAAEKPPAVTPFEENAALNKTEFQVERSERDYKKVRPQNPDQISYDLIPKAELDALNAALNPHGPIDAGRNREGVAGPQNGPPIETGLAEQARTRAAATPPAPVEDITGSVPKNVGRDVRPPTTPLAPRPGEIQTPVTPVRETGLSGERRGAIGEKEPPPAIPPIAPENRGIVEEALARPPGEIQRVSAVPPTMERAIAALEAKGTPEAAKLAQRLRENGAAELTRAEKRQIERAAGTATIPKTPGGKTTRTLSKANDQTKAMEAMQTVMRDFPPKEGETAADARSRYMEAVTKAKELVGGRDPFEMWSPRQKPQEWMWLKHADKNKGAISQRKFPGVQADETGIRNMPEQQRAERLAAGEMAKRKTGGEKAIAGEEARRATAEPTSVEDQMLEAIDRQRRDQAAGKFGEEPAEDVTGTVKEIKNAGDLTEKAGREKHNEVTNQLQANLTKAFDQATLKRKAEAEALVSKKAGQAPKASEDIKAAKKTVRKPELSAEEKQRILDKVNKTAPMPDLPPELRRGRMLKAVGETSVDEKAGTITRDAGNGETYVGKFDKGISLHDLLTQAQAPPGRGLFTVLFPKLRDTLASRAGNVKIYTMKEAELDKLVPGKVSGVAGSELHGGYLYNSDGTGGVIVINSDRVTDATRLKEVVVHEALHEITHQAIDENPGFAADITRLQEAYVWELARRNLSGVTYEYAASSPHEFITEALSNHHVADILSSTPVPHDMAVRFGLDQPRETTLWDRLVNMVRNVLNLPHQTFDGLSAALRMADIADTYRSIRNGLPLPEVSEHVREMAASMKDSGHDTSIDPFSRDMLEARGKKKKPGPQPGPVQNPAQVPARNTATQPTANAAPAFNRLNATYAGIKPTVEKWTGIPLSDYGRMTRAILGEMAAAKNNVMSQVINALDHRWYQWLKVPLDETMSYLKALETHNTEDMIQQAMATGTSRAHAETAAKADFVDYMKKLLGDNPANPDPRIAAKAAFMGDEMMVHRQMMQELFAWDKLHGSQADYVKNYVAHIFKNAGQAADYINNRIMTLGPTWYQKVRMFDLIDEAVKKGGMKLRYTNPIDIVTARYQASANANLMVGALRKMEQYGMAVPLANASPYQRSTWGDVHFYAGDRQNWVVRPESRQLFENALTREGLNNSNEIGSVYRAWMGIKNLWMPIQLGLSAFHALHLIGGIIPAQNIARAIQLSKTDGNWLGNLAKAGKLSLDQSIFAWPLDKIGAGIGKSLDEMSGNRFSEHMGRSLQEWWKMTPDQLRQAGPEAQFFVNASKLGGYSPYQPRQDIAGYKRKLAEALEQKSWTVVPKALARGIEKIQEPMFNVWIPQLKNELWMRGVAGLVKTNPGIASDPIQFSLHLHQLKNNIDDRFGEMFYDSKFWNPYVKDLAVGSMVSVGWNVGQLNQTGGSIRNLVMKATGKGTPMSKALLKTDDKLAFVGTYVGLSMGLAGMMTYALTGGGVPNSIMDYVYPRTGLTNRDGTPARLNTPSNIREVPTFIGHMQESGSAVSAAAHVLYNKTVLQPFFEMATNKDFFGKEMADPNAPWLVRQFQLADSVLGQHISPISITGAGRALQTPGAGAREAGLAVAGYGPAPAYTGHSAIENRILGMSRDRMGARPYEYGEKTGLGRGLLQGAVRGLAGDELKSEARQKGLTELAQAKQGGQDTSAAYQHLAGTGQMGKMALRKVDPAHSVERAFAGLPLDDQKSLVPKMNDAEFRRFVLTNPERFREGGAKFALIRMRTGG